MASNTDAAEIFHLLHQLKVALGDEEDAIRFLQKRVERPRPEGLTKPQWDSLGVLASLLGQTHQLLSDLAPSPKHKSAKLSGKVVGYDPAYARGTILLEDGSTVTFHRTAYHTRRGAIRVPYVGAPVEVLFADEPGQVLLIDAKRAD